MLLKTSVGSLRANRGKACHSGQATAILCTFCIATLRSPRPKSVHSLFFLFRNTSEASRAGSLLKYTLAADLGSQRAAELRWDGEDLALTRASVASGLSELELRRPISKTIKLSVLDLTVRCFSRIDRDVCCLESPDSSVYLNIFPSGCPFGIWSYT